MKILSKEDAGGLFSGRPLDSYLSELAGRLKCVVDHYAVQPDSGKKTALSRLLANLILRKSKVCIFVSGWGIWGSSENLDLFYGYRRSAGEDRNLMEAPVHIFEQSENDAFVSILSMVLYFVWDAWIFDISGTVLIRINHDEFFDVRTGDEEVQREIVAELEKLAGGPHKL